MKLEDQNYWKFRILGSHKYSKFSVLIFVEFSLVNPKMGGLYFYHLTKVNKIKDTLAQTWNFRFFSLPENAWTQGNTDTHTIEKKDY